MIIAATPFPSIEYIYGVEKLTSNCSLSSKTVSLNILSKGIYSAQMMKVLQEEPILISSLGGFAGKSIKHYLDKSKVKSDVVWTDYETPHQVKIIQSDCPDYYSLCSEEESSLDKELVKLTHKLKNHIKKVSTLVISGRLPQGQNANIYGQWVAEAKQSNVKSIVSTGQKEVFESVLQERPYAIMLTTDQLMSLDLYEDSYEELTKMLIPFLGQGLHYICIYMKNKGSLILSKNKYCLIELPFPQVNPNNTASSGAFLGALAISVNRQYEQEKMAKLCVCAALAAHDHVNESICTRKDVESRLKKVKIKQLMI